MLLTLLSFSSDAASVKSDPDKKNFRFFINADPQMGPEITNNRGLKILNELLENFVNEVNQKNQKSPVDFVVYNGDLVWDPYQNAFDNFTRIVSKQSPPVKLVHGNHDGYDDDPKFFQAQKQLSGYEKLNYSFDYGNWHFVVVGAQEKYLKEEQKQQQLAWLRNELAAHKDQQVMLFMHYHIMPVGLSQMEFYTYWPIEFKNQMLDIITEFGNVKYVFSGHVHTGVKASIKSSLEYKGIKFINSPTPVMARPFGEEYAEFEDKPDDRYFRRGFYLEVQVAGDQVKLIGHKIQHEHEVVYPSSLKKFDIEMDQRFFSPEAKTKPNKNIKNPSFDTGFEGWNKSYRYKKDVDNSFENVVAGGANLLQLKSPWGSWTFDEYMESYQIIDFNLATDNVLSYDFEKPSFSPDGAGGYIKIIAYGNDLARKKTILLHWGLQQHRVKYMYKSWFYNSDGNKFNAKDFNRGIKSGSIISIPINFDENIAQSLSLNLAELLARGSAKLDLSTIQSLSISHGVWARIMKQESAIMSTLQVNAVNLETVSEANLSEQPLILLNNTEINLAEADKEIPYHSQNKVKTTSLQRLLRLAITYIDKISLVE
jgi:DNA repair exonuclease SbcCD nuclease subunit